jgi:hypothetical protein
MRHTGCFTFSDVPEETPTKAQRSVELLTSLTGRRGIGITCLLIGSYRTLDSQSTYTPRNAETVGSYGILVP